MDEGAGGGVGRQFTRIGQVGDGCGTGSDSITVKKRVEVVTPATVTTLMRLVIAA